MNVEIERQRYMLPEIHNTNIFESFPYLEIIYSTSVTTHNALLG